MSGNTVKPGMPRCVLLSACPVAPQMADYLQKNDYIIACDAGYRNAAILGCTPQLIVGDFDSAPQPDFPDVVVLPHVKDDTDTQFAAQKAVELGAESVLMLGALGGARIEHTQANLCTGLYLQKHGVQTVIANEESELYFILPGQERSFARRDWKFFSVFPLEGELCGLCIRGAFYPLQNARLAADYPLGVSNEFVEPEITVSCVKGCGLVILTRE